MLTLLYLICHDLLTVVTMLIVGKHMGLVGKIYPYTPPKETGLGTPLRSCIENICQKLVQEGRKWHLRPSCIKHMYQILVQYGHK